MYSKEVLKAVEWAKENEIQFGRGAYRNGDYYCTVGVMALHMDIPKVNIMRNYIVHSTGGMLHITIAKHYAIEVEDLSLIIDLHDTIFRSWDDVIEFLKEHTSE